MRKKFWELFRVHPDGYIEPLRLISIAGVQFGPGIRFGKSVLFGGINLSEYIGHDFEIDEKDGVAVLKSIYQ